MSVLIATIGSVGMWSVVVVMPAIEAEFGTMRAASSLPYTMTMVGFAIGNVYMGRFVDKAGILLPVIGSALRARHRLCGRGARALDLGVRDRADR